MPPLKKARTSPKRHASKKRVAPAKHLPQWKTRWPRSADVKAWILCKAEKSLAITDPEERLDNYRFAMEALAQRKHEKEARRLIRGLFKLVPANDGYLLIDACRSAATVCMQLTDEAGALKYLDRIPAAQAFIKRPCDKTWAADAVRDFKIEHGLMDPDEFEDEDKRWDAGYQRACRQFDAALARGDKNAARLALADAERWSGKADKHMKRILCWHLIRCAADLGDARLTLDYVNSIKADERPCTVIGPHLLKVDLRMRMIAQANLDIAAALKELRSGDPNVHFPASSIQRTIEFLLDNGEPDLARRQLNRVLRDSRSWKVQGFGFASAGLYLSLAAVVARLDGREAAEELLKGALGEARGERRSDWRIGVMSELIELYQKIGDFERALELARKMRSGEKRKILACLLAQARRWDELHEVLRECKTPTEAADIAWWVAATLDGL